MEDNEQLPESFTQFYILLHQFLHNLTIFFPECLKSKFFLFGLNLLSRQKKIQAILEWHEQMKDYYAAVTEKNAAKIQGANIKLLEDFNVFAKYNDPLLDETKKNNLWEYLRLLNFYANSFNTSMTSSQQ